MKSVQFIYLTGLKRKIFRNARLWGSWDSQGSYSQAGTEIPMTDLLAEDGCPGFTATVQLDASQVGRSFNWGVKFDTPAAPNVWAIPTETNDPGQTNRVRTFQLQPGQGKQIERYFCTNARRLGARKIFRGGKRSRPGLRFSVWAPNAQKVEVVFGDPTHGYIADDGFGIDPARPALSMKRGADGIWQTQDLPNYPAYDGAPYMYRLVNAQGRTVYRTDLYARQQIGHGTFDPHGAHYGDSPDQLEGTKSCSLVVTLDTIAEDFMPPPGKPVRRIPEDDFWAHEFTPGLPVPSRVEDLVIYELHIGALGFGQLQPGNLADAMALLPHLTDLGVNAVELLPMSEFSGIGWGYGDSHYFVIESSAG